MSIMTFLYVIFFTKTVIYNYYLCCIRLNGTCVYIKLRYVMKYMLFYRVANKISTWNIYGNINDYMSSIYYH